jgi:hypothetical protein
MGFGPNPPIAADATRRALNPEQARAAGRSEADAERAVLDEQEIRELEQAELYDASGSSAGASGIPTPVTDPGVEALGDGPVKRFFRSLLGHR